MIKYIVPIGVPARRWYREYSYLKGFRGEVFITTRLASYSSTDLHSIRGLYRYYIFKLPRYCDYEILEVEEQYLKINGYHEEI